MRTSARFALAVSAAVTVVLTGMAPSATAGGSPHFISHATYSSLSGSSLVANFKEAGLAAGSQETLTLSATESVTYECVNGGGKNPSASNKHTFVTTSSTSGVFTADKNGNLVGSLTLAPASPSSVGFSCPPGQRLTFVGVTYRDVTLTDWTSGISTTLADQSYTNPSAPPVR
jgi:hypothetical protein